MPNLLIAKVDGVWTASPANSGVSYVFQSADGGQEVALQQLSVAMKDGVEALTNGTPEIFVVPEGVTPSQVIETLFNTTDTLTYVNSIIYGTVGDEMLIDDIEMAGEALSLALL